eukprot:CAMPEP_0203827986 /NCGR_PEP_ID=MMETSP0115-20131106/60286_1 /ASSEMBLY_ACC=CAM_ASM_000227 /TAXON_ID=33651 /ORGANISM="Bicosoecid sp, Strain ms1" /LENGTH=108 /DNA_ID=CAMNT_0050737045 /DNA_START=73 /DNA_END=396 /DNA_ORIENTATION=-
MTGARCSHGASCCCPACCRRASAAPNADLVPYRVADRRARRQLGAPAVTPAAADCDDASCRRTASSTAPPQALRCGALLRSRLAWQHAPYAALLARRVRRRTPASPPS